MAPGNGSKVPSFIPPSKIILKLLNEYQILCQFCKRPFEMREVINHENLQCKNTLCANELCGVPLEHLPEESLVKFTMTRMDALGSSL